MIIGVLAVSFAWARRGHPTEEADVPIPVTIEDRGEVRIGIAKGITVSQLLVGEEIEIAPADMVFPALTTPLTPGTRVVVKRAPAVAVAVDGGVRGIRGFDATVEELLSSHGIVLAPLDRVTPARDAWVFSGMEIRVTRVTEEDITIEEPIPFTTEYQENGELIYGRETVVEEGREGLARVEYHLRYENGREVKRKRIAYEVVAASTARIVERGTKIVALEIQEGIGSFYQYRGGFYAAHKTWPKGSHVKVTNLETGNWVVVTINDRGPYVEGRVIDLDLPAFEALAPRWKGVIPVRIERIES
ncbi:MAG: G5 domain-containing protein [Parcubacteria group bacterium]|nr:G5 domain-containing protein [Parcubacteria group bacterium]